MSKDILHKVRTDSIFNETLIKIDIYLTINNKVLIQLDIVTPRRLENDLNDHDL